MTDYKWTMSKSKFEETPPLNRRKIYTCRFKTNHFGESHLVNARDKD